MYFTALVHEPLEVGRESSHGTKELFNLSPLVLKVRHIRMNSPMFGIGSR